MSRRPLRALSALFALCAGLATAAGPAAARPASAIVRPADEAGTSLPELGAELFAGNCLRCHGIAGTGIRTPAGRGGGIGPSLHGVGARSADFYLRTGYMPLAAATDQPSRSRVLLHGREIRGLVAYIASLGGGPAIPSPEPARGSLSGGLQLFTEHCAGCHQITGQGGVVTGARVPPLSKANATQIAEAVRTGPSVMPRFGTRQISGRQLDSIIRYVMYTRHPDNRGGWGIGNLGPFPEGLVSWFLAGGLLVGVCLLTARRARQ
ncbi:MAG TPA: cytochrome c [Gaiellales bacterium]